MVRLSIRARLPKPLHVVPLGTSRETAIIHQVDLQSLMVHFSARLANGDFVCTLSLSHFFQTFSFLLTFSPRFLFAEVLSSSSSVPASFCLCASRTFSLFFVVGFMGPGVFFPRFFDFRLQAIRFPRSQLSVRQACMVGEILQVHLYCGSLKRGVVHAPGTLFDTCGFRSYSLHS